MRRVLLALLLSSCAMSEADANAFASDVIAAADIDDPDELDTVLFSFCAKSSRCAGDCAEELVRCKHASTKERVELLARCGMQVGEPSQWLRARMKATAEEARPKVHDRQQFDAALAKMRLN